MPVVCTFLFFRFASVSSYLNLWNRHKERRLPLVINSRNPSRIFPVATRERSHLYSSPCSCVWLEFHFTNVLRCPILVFFFELKGSIFNIWSHKSSCQNQEYLSPFTPGEENHWTTINGSRNVRHIYIYIMYIYIYIFNEYIITVCHINAVHSTPYKWSRWKEYKWVCFPLKQYYYTITALWQ